MSCQTWIVYYWVFRYNLWPGPQTLLDSKVLFEWVVVLWNQTYVSREQALRTWEDIVSPSLRKQCTFRTLACLFECKFRKALRDRSLFIARGKGGGGDFRGITWFLAQKTLETIESGYVYTWCLSTCAWIPEQNGVVFTSSLPDI